MAKKVRRLHEEEEAAFEFPEFDETAFLSKESELGYALVAASAFAVVAGVLSALATLLNLPYYVPLPLGFVYLGLSYPLLSRLRPNSSRFTKGDWAALFALQFFAWVAVWFLLVDLI